MDRLQNIFWLGIKELRSLQRDPVIIVLLVFSFTFSVYTRATGSSTEVHHASIALVDEDRSTLARQISQAFYLPYFQEPQLISAEEIDPGMDQGRFMFVLNIPPRFEADVLAGRQPEIQVNIDATAVMQASIGASYIQNIISDEITRFVQSSGEGGRAAVELVTRTAFNPNRTSSWFNSIFTIIDQITMLTIVLTGAALIREREHGTIEHLLVMPLTSLEIAIAKVWSNGLVILFATAVSLLFVVEGILSVPIAGSKTLFLLGTTLYLFFATALGIFLGTIARSMAQFALLIVLVIMPLSMLSGGNTPVESQPDWLQTITLFLPSRHFVSFSQAVIYRGAGLDIVWPELLAVAGLGLVFFVFSLRLFRRSIALSN
ncbi:ABC-2 type transport system permease protein [Nitrosomonas aestuarii]|uniref:ABC-2 type transport system permease protein n=1 Tax=Nitrosomonas aestuarii TaxID=52441 RepID=A0A1I4HEX4_9PROT|nr:ABC transporter permease [Nitrosomonas aestuarii]SFL40061.1 ABC-2 type transport system permease protein [Nitrosomonas aestuarii]